MSSVIFKEEFAKEKAKAFAPMGFKNQRRNLRKLKQVGKTNADIDVKRKALLSGKRISKNGNEYWETRKNRSDNPQTHI